MNIPNFVRSSARFIVSQSTHVKINPEKLQNFAKWVTEHKDYDELECSSHHPTAKEFSLEQIVKFYFIVDTLNFCFWHNDMEYGDLVEFVKNKFVEQNDFFTLKNFEKISAENFTAEFSKFMKDERNQLPERYRLVHETLAVVEHNFGGSFLNVVRKADFDAIRFLNVLSSNWLGFNDHSLYKGRQVGFYKRAQILVGDVLEAIRAYKFSGIVRDEVEGKFLSDLPPEIIKNTHLMTGFPDYRVPQVLYHFGVMEYSQQLSEIIDKKEDIPSGSEMELEIRGANVECLGQLSDITGLTDIQIDWILWQWGEKNLDKLKPHHRVLTIFY